MAKKPKKSTQKKTYDSISGRSGGVSGQANAVAEPMAVLEKTGSFPEFKTDELPLEVIKKLREGYSFGQFKDLVQDIPLDYGDWPKILHMSKRTMDRHKNDNRSFNLSSSERIFEIKELYHLGLEVFEDGDTLNRWLFRSNPTLNGLAPKDLFDTSVGIGLIKEQLLQIEYGILA